MSNYESLNEEWVKLDPGCSFIEWLIDHINLLETNIFNFQEAQPVVVGYIDDMDADCLRHLKDNPELAISHVSKEQEDDYQIAIYLDPISKEKADE